MYFGLNLLVSDPLRDPMLLLETAGELVLLLDGELEWRIDLFQIRISILLIRKACDLFSLGTRLLSITRTAILLVENCFNALF